MKVEEFKEILRELGWSQAELCRRIGVTPNTTTRWAKGYRPIPGSVAEYLRLKLKARKLGE